jgi:hypothetical protein
MAKLHDHRSIHASPPLRSPTNWMKAFLFLKTTHRAWATRAWQEAWAGLSVDGARALRIHRPALVMTGVFCTLLVGFGSLDGMACASSMESANDGTSGIVQTESESESVVSFFVCSFALVCGRIHSDH